MTLSTWIRRLFARKSPSRVPIVRDRQRKGRPPVRPALEILEERWSPAVLTVNTLADNITDTGHLTLRDAVALVHTGGRP
jgi:hypothetical protein